MSTPHIHVQAFGHRWSVTCYGNDGRARHFANCYTHHDAMREAALLAHIYRVPKRVLIRSRQGVFVKEL